MKIDFQLGRQGNDRPLGHRLQRDRRRVRPGGGNPMMLGARSVIGASDSEHRLTSPSTPPVSAR